MGFGPENALEKIRHNPKFRKHWHSQFEIEELRSILELINKVYRRDVLSLNELSAAQDLKTCVAETNFERRLNNQRKSDDKLMLARAISASAADPLWRECLEIVIAQSPKPDTIPA